MRFFRCNICGNLIAVINDGGGELVCCGESMEELIAKTEDEGREKHLPVIVREGTKVTVKVGSTLHPMLENHYIQWIAIVYNNKISFTKLKYNDEPIATFTVDEDIDEITAYEYCNIHGLWSSVYKK